MPKLLIVDDEIDVREFAKNFFKRRKIDVITASSGEETLALVEKEKPDLILLDILMEGLDGIETLQKMRQAGHKTDVIMVTGLNEDATVKKAEALGILGYIHKPLILDELEEIVLKRLVKDK